MKRFFRDLLFMAVGSVLLWIVFSKWIGINVPLGSKDSPTKGLLGSRMVLPEGFVVKVFASDLSGVRMLHLTPTGDILASIPKGGRIVLLEGHQKVLDQSMGRRDLLTGLNRPHGVEIYKDWLYVAETGAIGRIGFDVVTGKTHGIFERIVTGLPSGGNHWSRSLHFGPDGMMYVSIGSSCNVCEEDDPRRASIMRFHPDGSNGEIYASGLRNTVGFGWRPETNELYGVDNGRDLLGDDFPPCELNLIEQGKFYGWPYANGNKITDPDIGVGHGHRISESMGPVYGFGAHTAPLAITFLQNKNLPPTYVGAAIVSLHGSWNRSKKIGYQLVSLHFDGSGNITERPFLTGFEVDGDVIGRPVDVVEGKDGSLFVSDDYSGTIYRVNYSGTTNRR